MSMGSEGEAGRFEGRYGDGRSAASQRVTVELGPDGLVIVDGTGRARSWRYDRLAVAVPVDRRAGDVLLTRTAPKPSSQDATSVGAGEADLQASNDDPVAATLFVSNPAFVGELRRRAPHITSRGERWRYLKPGLWVTAAAALATVLVWVTGASPSRMVASLVPQRAWSAIGEHAIASMFPQQRMCSAPAGRAALDAMAARLAAVAEPGATREPFVVNVLDSPILNAFAVPGRQIVLTRRLVATAKSPEELAGVLAHEMGHGLERHPEASIVRVMGLVAVAKLVLSGGGDTLANIGVMLAQLRYTREAEREADAHAIRILREAGVSSAGLVSFFERIRRDERPGGTGKAAPVADILSTHPSLDERIETVSKVPPWPTRPILSEQAFRDLAAICG